MNSRKAAAIAFNILAIALRLFAIFLCALTVMLCFPGVSTQLGLVDFVVDLSRAIPSVIAGYGLIATPFGGVFRFDFALTAVVCFALDWLFVKLSYQVR